MSDAQPQNASSTEKTNITLNDLYNQLKERVSVYNARLILDSAVVRSGIGRDSMTPLNKEDGLNVCMELIKNGGPAFHVGKDFYTRIQ